MDFPKFDGVNPRLWREQCEVYFEIYGVSEPMKTRFATLNFVGSGALWLQTVQLRGLFQSWEAMHTAVCAHFDKDQYPLYMKQLENLRQTGSVADYQKSFEKLAHSILLYNPSYDDVFFVTRFLSGLKEEVRAPIALHRPPNLETAGTLALLQEAELEGAKNKWQSKSEHRDNNRFQARQGMQIDKTRGRKEEAKSGEAATAGNASDKLSALKAFRRANNLCFVCGEKWTGRNHKCPTQVPIHVIQELLEAVQIEPELDYSSSEEDSEANGGQVVMAVTPICPVQSAVGMSKKNRTLRLKGLVGSHEVLILVDSGSAGTFVSQELANTISQPKQACETVQFTSADGNLMISDLFIPMMQWHVQGHTFTHDTRVLPLQCYDMVLGADWLEEKSPMWIHWKKKHMRFTHNNKRILLKGVTDATSRCSQVSVHKLKGLLKKKAIVHLLELKTVCPVAKQDAISNPVMSISSNQPQQSSNETSDPASDPQLQQLLNQYQHLFQEPVGLPPQRSCDHHIPLIPGAQPVNVWPYRYAPH
jgi:hypothetical protein